MVYIVIRNKGMINKGAMGEGDLLASLWAKAYGLFNHFSLDDLNRINLNVILLLSLFAFWNFSSHGYMTVFLH